MLFVSTPVAIGDRRKGGHAREEVEDADEEDSDSSSDSEDTDTGNGSSDDVNTDLSGPFDAAAQPKPTLSDAQRKYFDILGDLKKKGVDPEKGGYDVSRGEWRGSGTVQKRPHSTHPKVPSDTWHSKGRGRAPARQ